MSDDYSHIDNPYTELLSRTPQMAVATGNPPAGAGSGVVGGGYSGSGGGGVATSAPSAAASEDGDYSASSSGGSVETTAVKSAGTLSDVWIDTFIKSENWQPKRMGFYLDGKTGYAEFTNVYVSGPIVAISGSIGGWTIGATELSNGSVHLKSTAEQILIGSATTPTVGTGIFIGKSGSAYEFRAGDPAGAYMLWDGSSLQVNAPTIFTPLISTALATGSILNIQGWQFTGTLAASGSSIVTWTAGTLSFADGQSFSILAGTTGTMSAHTYIYFDSTTSITALQVGTSSSAAVGANKVLIATADTKAGGAKFMMFNNNSLNVDGSDIVANSVTANNIAANTITAAQIAANTITANQLSSTLVYAGQIIIDTLGNIEGGQTAFDTGTGFFLGYSGGQYKFSIGNSASDKMTWDGSNLRIKGNLELSSILNLISFTVATLPIPATADGPHPPSAFE